MGRRGYRAAGVVSDTQKPPWDLDVIHEIQAIVFQHYGVRGEIVPDYISTQIDDFIALGMAYALPDNEAKP